MSIIPYIDYDSYSVNSDPANETTSARVYVRLKDENNQAVNGNGLVVTVQISHLTGQPDLVPVTVMGMSQSFYDGVITRQVNGVFTEMISFQVLSSAVPATPVTAIIDAHIDSVTVNKNESGPWAADARVNINAFSSYQPISYRIDDLPAQESPVFGNLTGGGHTAYITDANGNTASFSFNITTATSLLVSDPSVDLGGGNISRWNAVFNPVVFTYQRKDFEVTGIGASNQGTQISVNADLSQIKAGDKVYVNAGAYKGTYNVLANQTYSIVIDTPFVSSTYANGFLNSNTMRSYYNVTTRITYQDESGNMATIASTNRPDANGIVRADLSSFLQSLLAAKDTSTYTNINYRDSNLSASYQVAYAESWTEPSQANGQPGAEYPKQFVTVNTPYYITYSAKQLGQKYGGNMAAYVPFKQVVDPDQHAKWITDFAEPAYSNGYPFDIGFIYSEDLLGLNLYYELTMLDANRKVLGSNTITSYLLNEDSTYLLNQDNSRLLIKQTDIGNPLPLTPNQLGLNRLMIDTVFPTEAYYFTLTLKYNDDNQITRTVTQTQTVRIDDAVDDHSVYLRWIGLNGSWNYYRFVYNQEISLDVQNAVIIKNYVSDWEMQEGIEEVISKSAGEKMKVMAEDLSVNDIRGLQSIKYAPKVQLLVNKNPVKWQTVVINSATFSEYETRYGQYAFSVTFNRPSINIQTQ